MISQIIGRKMIAQRSGKIINLASQAGIVALDKHLAYCASKAAIISLTKVLAYEWGRFNINVNSISPTVVLTELGKKAWAGPVGDVRSRRKFRLAGSRIPRKSLPPRFSLQAMPLI